MAKLFQSTIQNINLHLENIYATSVDYQPDTDLSQQFATVQNKAHWATHGHTAAEIVHERTVGFEARGAATEVIVLHSRIADTDTRAGHEAG